MKKKGLIKNPPPWAVGVVVLLFIAGMVSRVLGPSGGDPSLLLAFGEEAPETLDYATALLGHVDPRNRLGHDGKFFFVLGNDPFLLDPANNAVHLDRPTYRSQRILYPMLAGLFGLLPPRGVMWGMVLLNMLAMGAGTWGTGVLARSMGGSSWWGLAFGFNVGLVSEVAISGGGVLAFAFGVWALVATHRRRDGLAAVLLTLAALSREAMLVMAWGVAAYLLANRRARGAVAALVLPLAAVGAWAIYVRSRLGWPPGGADVQEIGLPFVGMARASRAWLDSPIDLTAGLVVVLLLLLFARRALTTRSALAWSTVGFVPLAFVFSRQVWLSYFDITRAVAPAITAFVLLAFAAHPKRVHVSTN